MASILNTVKSLLGISESDTDFDQELIVFINSSMGALHLLGVGSTEVFSITNSTTTWAQFLGSSNDFEMAKSYIYMKVRLVFDPPNVSFVLTAFEQMIAEIEFRLTTQANNAVIDARPISVVE